MNMDWSRLQAFRIPYWLCDKLWQFNNKPIHLLVILSNRENNSGIVNLLFTSAVKVSQLMRPTVMWWLNDVILLFYLSVNYIPGVLKWHFFKVKRESEQLLRSTDLLPWSQLSFCQRHTQSGHTDVAPARGNFCERGRSKP